MRPAYGIDAPGLVRGFAGTGVVLAVAGLALSFGFAASWASMLGSALLIVALYSLGMCALMLHGSLIVKVRDRERILDLVQWRGDERVLDVGCGRGLMLVGAAKRLTTGRSVGIDIWSARDQASNDAERPLENARREGVAERVEVLTADMRDLPFPDGSFNVILSNWVVHNVDDVAERRNALAEMVRVTRPGGSILLTDIVNHGEYSEALAALGCTDVSIVILSRLRFGFLRAITFGTFAPATVRAFRSVAQG
ncbi:class I SAM-dependent methyltransferase [Sphingomonas sp. SUN039]|uniref:class I SAM-dependent methyltransferase n=1 Tax=Sphingomonas sp. SUN039 TaxID=2937787 RepID=UPI0021643EA0|nr:class I SAM-dependent methyltransferase [Sphingomonas sp. SUN039]UVO53343.1 class I SAM-dependent methyltransferase [Sphingomonas sp. SUN039]